MRYEWLRGLRFEDDALEAIADKALERKTGARGLRSIIEEIMMDVMYRVPSDDTITECIITKAAVDGENDPVIVYNTEGSPIKKMDTKRKVIAKSSRGESA